jgi:hypothetical protein
LINHDKYQGRLQLTPDDPISFASSTQRILGVSLCHPPTQASIVQFSYRCIKKYL